MAINTAMKVEIGTVAAPTDFTSRTLGLSVDQQVDVNVIGRGTCRITLLNKDGALTPNGGGTYSSTDWFAQGVFVSAITDTGGASATTAVFHGIVVDFDLVDDGVYSTVTITAVDGLTVGGKSIPPTLTAISPAASYLSIIQLAFNAGYGTLSLPRLGKDDAFLRLDNLTTDQIFTPVTSATAKTFSSYADLWQTTVIPTGNDVVWATVIDEGLDDIAYVCVDIPFANTRDTAYRTDFVFDPSGSISGTDLPFKADNFQQAFNNDTLITNATIQGNYSGATSVTSTAATVNTYGARTVAFTDTLVVDSTAASDMATKLTNRYSTSRFTPVSLSLSASLVKAKCDDAAKTRWETLLSITDGIWQKATVTWAGSGAATQTADCVIKGRRIDATPQDVTITLTLGNWIDNHGFILDIDELNTDRLG